MLRVILRVLYINSFNFFVNLKSRCYYEFFLVEEDVEELRFYVCYLRLKLLKGRV